ncbi:uncharacterized protein LOC142322581 [Lycorma delicatula]|uniref:uncharacterized protein LOC142322581 n=1 Tax=Lycorma delicatula TaxID=130591 RepID=UPI003F512AC6
MSLEAQAKLFSLQLFWQPYDHEKILHWQSHHVELWQLLGGGRTEHSALKLPFNMQIIETPTCNINKNSGTGKLLKGNLRDECTTVHKKALEGLHQTLQDLRGNEQLFGSALILFSGDFRQTLSVIPRSTPTNELNACISSSVLR